MKALTEKFGIVGAEAFIALIQREKLDYTKWRENDYDGVKPEDF